nr:hypothetical protein [Orientia tsutsugamushi]
MKYNFSRKKDNVYHTVLIPDYVNQDFKNIQTLMNEVERTAKKRQQPVVEGYSNSIARREGAKFRA